MTARIFAALVPPEDAVEHLADFLEPRRTSTVPEDGLRWTRPELFHVTLAFMESVEESRVDDSVDRLADGLSGTPTVDLRLAGPVAFPDVGTARLLAVGVQPQSQRAEPVLERLAGRARSAAVAAGIEVDGGRFRPHLTVARFRRPTEATRWVHVLETYAGPAWPAREVAVVASHLGEGARGTPRYEMLAGIPLGG